MSLQLIEAAKVLRFDPATGWPEQFTVKQAIALQTWHEGIAPKAWGSKAGDLHRLFDLDRDKGAVKVTTTTARECIKPERHVTPPELNLGTWPARYTRGGVRYGYTEKAEYKDVTTHHITAEAFAAWLAANELVPSRHVAAWFDAVGAGALRLVEEAIDTDSELHKSWMTEAKRGKVRAALLLGVVLWAISGDEPSPQTDRAIVEGWAEKLMAATVEKWRSGRAVCPLNPVTLIEIEGQPKGLRWVMTLEGADAFLEAHALAFKCSDVLAYWRGEPSPYSETVPVEPVEQVEGKEERQDRRLQACIDAGLPMNERALLRLPDGVGALAKSEGVTRQAFTEDVKAALKRKVERERPKPRLVKRK